MDKQLLDQQILFKFTNVNDHSQRHRKILVVQKRPPPSQRLGTPADSERNIFRQKYILIDNKTIEQDSYAGGNDSFFKRHKADNKSITNRTSRTKCPQSSLKEVKLKLSRLEGLPKQFSSSLLEERREAVSRQEKAQQGLVKHHRLAVRLFQRSKAKSGKSTIEQSIMYGQYSHEQKCNQAKKRVYGQTDRQRQGGDYFKFTLRNRKEEEDVTYRRPLELVHSKPFGLLHNPFYLELKGRSKFKLEEVGRRTIQR